MDTMWKNSLTSGHSVQKDREIFTAKIRGNLWQELTQSPQWFLDTFTVGQDSPFNRAARELGERLAQGVTTGTATGTIEMPKLPDMAIAAVPDGALAENEHAEYLALCRKLGLKCDKNLLESEFLRFLQREEIPVYDSKAVLAYMTQMAAKAKQETGNYHRWAVNSLESVSSPVPIEALRLVDKIKGGFPDAKFEVHELRSDPFLSVNVSTGKSWYICHWDEPTFSVLGNKQEK